MVEFGLKLQDNQVSEWSNHYINYELLKQLLQKSKQTLQKYQEQAKKKPELAKAIKSNFDRGINSFITTTPPMSSDKLSGLVKDLASATSSLSPPNKKEYHDVGTGTIVNESTGLLAASVSPSSPPLDANTSTTSVHSVLSKAVSSVSGFFEKRYEQMLRDTLAEIAAQEVEIDTQVMQEVGSVPSHHHGVQERAPVTSHTISVICPFINM
jgi:SPX domain